MSSRCGVHFHHVDMAAFHDGRAMLANAAWFCCWAAVAVRADAVHAFGNDPGGGGFAGSPDARHDEGLRDAVGRKGILERAHHGILPDEIDECLGPVFAGENLIGGLCWGVV